jgi:hypothetical protein
VGFSPGFSLEEVEKMKMLRMVFLFVLLAGVTTLQGCAFMTGVAVGGAAGYVIHDEGYRVQSPIKK